LLESVVCQGGEENNAKTQEKNPLFAPTRYQFPHIGPGNHSADGHEAHDPTDGGLAAPNRLKIDGIEVEDGNVGKNQEHQDIEKKKRTDPGTAGTIWRDRIHQRGPFRIRTFIVQLAADRHLS
jgi:hypothetical protein